MLGVRDLARRALRWIEPHGLASRRRFRREARARAEQDQRYAVTKAAIAQPSATIHDYDQLMTVAVEAGADPERLQRGSISVDSLDFIIDRIERGPGLHVGNYAGVSLAYLAAHTDGLVVGVDPNVSRWGATKGQDVVVRVLQAAGLEERVLLVCGYTLERNPNYNGRVTDGYDPSVEYRNEAAPVQVLGNLRALGIQFGWVLLDGNHDGAYVRAELEQLEALLGADALVLLDDCTPAWPGVRAVFDDPPAGWQPDGHNGRIGVLRRTGPEGSVSGQSQPQVVP